MERFYEPDVLLHLQKVEMEIVRDFDRICREHNLVYFGFAGTGIGALRHKGYIPWDDDIDISMPRKDYDEIIRLIVEEMGDKYYILNSDTDPNYPLATTRICLKGTVFREWPMKDVDCKWGIFLDLYALDNAADGKFAYFWQMWRAWFWSKMVILYEVPKPVLFFDGFKAKMVTGICVAIHHTMRFLHISKKRMVRKREKASRKYNNRITERIAYFCDPKPHTNTFSNSDIYPLQELQFEDIKMPFPNHLDALMTKMFGDYMTPPPEDKRHSHCPYQLEFGPYGKNYEENE